MTAKRNFALKREPVPYLIAVGPDEEWGFEISALSLIPCYSLNELEKIIEDASDSRSYGGEVWGVYIWNRVKYVYEFLSPDNLYGK